MNHLYHVESKPYSLWCPYKQWSLISAKSLFDLKKYDLSVMSPPISIPFENVIWCLQSCLLTENNLISWIKGLIHHDKAWPWTVCHFRAAKPCLSVKDTDCEQQDLFMTAQRIPNCSEHGHSVCDMSRPVLVKIPSLLKFPAFWKWHTSPWIRGLMRNLSKNLDNV